MFRYSIVNVIPLRSVWITTFVLVCSCTCAFLRVGDRRQNSSAKQTEDARIVRVAQEGQMESSAAKPNAPQNNRASLLKSLRAKVCKERKRGRNQTSSVIKTRIVGGHNARPHEFPYQVLFTDYRGVPYCGGTIYNEFYIISAAHCFTPDAEKLTPVVGEHNVKTKEGNEQVLSIRSIKLHENYNTETFHNDIVIIELRRRIKYSEFVQPVKLPTTFTERSGSATVTGWGVLKFGSYKQPDVLQKVSVPLITNEECRPSYSTLIETQLCAGFLGVGGKDACQGDSGGPLTVKNSDGTYTLIGIVSAGIDCASPKFPGLYTDVYRFTNWIKRNTA